MNIFLVTDNKWWFDKSMHLFKDHRVNIEYFCSPKGVGLFSEEISKGLIKPFDIKNDYQSLIGKFELGISCHCKQIFPKELVNTIKCINIHPGLNPYNRGWFPQVFSILNKKPVGATIHIMDAEIDHGEILFQEEVEIFDWDTSKTVYDRVLEVEYRLLSENLASILNGRCVSKVMEVEGNYNSVRDYKQLLEIDLNKIVTMREAIDYLRAMTHPPYRNAYFFNETGEKIYLSIKLEKE